MEKKNEEELPAYLDKDVTLINESVNQFISDCSNEVFRSFLPEVAKQSEVIPYESMSSVSDSVAYFEIKKFVENENEEMVDCLRSVYHVLANSGCGVALVIHRKQNGCEIGLAVGNYRGSSERTIKETERLKDAFLGVFSGSDCGEIYTDLDSTASLFTQISSNYNSNHNNSVAIVSNIATEFSEDYSTQGIEKLLDGIRPSSPESEYTLVILGESLLNEELKVAKERLYKNYNNLSPFESTTQNVTVNKNGKTVAGSLVLVSVSGTAGESGAKSRSVEISNYRVKHTLEEIEKQMKRLEESEALGLWNYATYVISPDLAVANGVANMYMSLTQGKDSFAVQSSINVWNGQNNEEFEKIKAIMKHLRSLHHPRFLMLNGSNERITATNIVSGVEFARSLSLPQKSVEGVPVYKCARFGRNVSTYTDSDVTPVEIGRIYHMRREENTALVLDKKSLTSHVFITGSTGSGKTNTVFELLKRSKVPFLVIEPAKGEYKNIFGGYDDVRVLGTNPKLTELLRINPFSFPENISVSEHVDRLVELFNVCWPMYAAMPAILKDAVIKAYESAGWDMVLSENRYDNALFPTFTDVLYQIRQVLKSSDYSADNKSDYTGALVTRLRSLTNGINGMIFSAKDIPDKELFDSKVIVDLSRVGSTETRAMIMGLLVMKLQEYRLSDSKPDNRDLCHITVLEEAHNILKRTSTEQTSEGANLLGKSVEMLTNAIAELRAFGEGFVIADQAPGLLDMAVIRNTNTKIIHRLPDLSDRELAGSAAGLADEQIGELAKLELGVAAVYQNDWVEPVLCKVYEFSDSEKKLYTMKDSSTLTNYDLTAKKMVRDVLLKPHEYVKVDMTLLNDSNLPVQIKTVMIRMNKGQDVPVDEKAEMFYQLYPKIGSRLGKDDSVDYLENLQDEIIENCGQLSSSELKLASIYIAAVLRELSQISIDVYESIRKGLSLNGSGDCRGC